LAQNAISIELRGVAIFAKAFMGIPAQQAAKITRPLMPSAAPAVLLHSLHTQQGVCNIVIAMTRRDFGKPAFSLRKKRSVKTHALSLLGTTRLLSRSERLPLNSFASKVICPALAKIMPPKRRGNIHQKNFHYSRVLSQYKISLFI
jgi:hypothetical protein